MHVRFAPKADKEWTSPLGLLCAKTGHEQLQQDALTEIHREAKYSAVRALWPMPQAAAAGAYPIAVLDW
jgi:hypothetical protein